MPCCIAERHTRLAPPDNYPLTVGLRVAESRIAERTIARRKRRILDKYALPAAALLKRAFKSEAGRVLDALKSYRLPYAPKLQDMAERVAEAKTFGPVTDPEFRRLLDYILNSQSLSPYDAALDALYRDVMPHAMDAATAEAMAAAGMGITGTLGRFPGAEQWIREHAIRFGKRFAPGVTEATNNAIRTQLAQGWAQFESIDKLMARVRSVYDTATNYRAEMIARTEGNRAYTEASHEAYDQLGAQGHFWILSGSEYAVWPEICAVNAEKGIIAFDESFEDIDGGEINGPPAHPNCLCDEGIDISAELPDWVQGVA